MYLYRDGMVLSSRWGGLVVFQPWPSLSDEVFLDIRVSVQYLGERHFWEIEVLCIVLLCFRMRCDCDIQLPCHCSVR